MSAYRAPAVNRALPRVPLSREQLARVAYFRAEASREAGRYIDFAQAVADVERTGPTEEERELLAGESRLSEVRSASAQTDKLARHIQSQRVGIADPARNRRARQLCDAAIARGEHIDWQTAWERCQ